MWQACLESLAAKTGGKVKIDGLDGVLTSRRVWGYRYPLTMEMEVSCYCVPQTSKYLRGSVQTEGKYSELVYLVFEGKTWVLSAVRMY